MKIHLMRFGLVLGVALMGVSCTTAYDAQGRAKKVVSPEGALVGVAAAGFLAYALGRDQSQTKKNSHCDRKGHHRTYRDGYGNYGRYGGRDRPSCY